MEKTHYAVCVLNPDGGSGVSGIVHMSQVEGQKCRITAEIKGLTQGLHGFHIHQFGKYKRIFHLIFIYL
jgi:Cu-Zn family superoxide dismutase